MKNRRGISFSTVLGLIVAVMVFALVPALGWTACTIGGALDTDCDGYTDVEEGSPIVLADGVTTITLDPAVPDIVVAVVPASGTLMPPDPLEYVRNLGINVTQVTHTSVGVPDSSDPCRYYSDRYVTANQRALILCESLSSSYGPVGASVWGSPNRGPGWSKVYTQRIWDVVYGTCKNPARCSEAHTGVTGAANVVAVYIKHTIAHEIFHTMRGVPRDIDQDGVVDDTYVPYGDHYPSPSDPTFSVVMEPQVVYKKGQFYLPVHFANPDFLQADNIYEE